VNSNNIILWEVDVQRDFMLPEGKLYVPGAEKLLPNIQRLTTAAREGKAFLVSHGCFHTADDPEFRLFAAHCVKGTPGAEFMPEALAATYARIPNEAEARLPEDLSKFQQVVLEKQTLDVFQSRHAEELLARLDASAEFAVFGVATEYCVRLAANGLLDRGRQVAIVQDAIETIDPKAGEETIVRLRARGARMTTTKEVLKVLRAQ
jgi:nicotinamidase/pyrazinamidase